MLDYYSGVAKVVMQFGTAALLLLYCCFTAALLLLYCCFTAALLLLYCCDRMLVYTELLWSCKNRHAIR
jgi:hypothetical protein